MLERDSPGKIPKDPRSIITMIVIISICLLSFVLMYNRDYPSITNIGVGNIAIFGDSAKININTASIESLKSLPGIGEVLAKRIIQERPYGDLEELNRVKGIGDKTIDGLRGKVDVR